MHSTKHAKDLTSSLGPSCIYTNDESKPQTQPPWAGLDNVGIHLGFQHLPLMWRFRSYNTYIHTYMHTYIHIYAYYTSDTHRLQYRMTYMRTYFALNCNKTNYACMHTYINTHIQTQLIMLLDSGVPVDSQDGQGNTILIVACQNNHKKVAKEALRRDCDINHQNKRVGWSIWHNWYMFRSIWHDWYMFICLYIYIYICTCPLRRNAIKPWNCWTFWGFFLHKNVHKSRMYSST
jgi:hypothetical protein